MIQPQDYEYRGLMAQTWDLFRGDTSTWEDRFFFLDLIHRCGQPVLDVGCGTGRLLLDFMAQGIDIEGVDNSPEMLQICRRKAKEAGLQPTLYEQVMEQLNLPRRYRTIMVPSSSFQLVLDRELAAQATQRFYEHLMPEGVLAMPFLVLWHPGDPLESDWEQTGEAIRPDDGALLRRWSKSRFDPEASLEHTEDLYEVVLHGEVVESEHHRRSPATRAYTQEQALVLYRQAGFRNIEVYGGFTAEPVSAGDNVFTVIGRRA